MVGTPGGVRAADYIAEQFAAARLHPGADGAWRQYFAVPGLRVPSPASSLECGRKAFGPGRDFSPMAIGGQGRFRGALVFAGYGITARCRRYDDYAGLDVRGAVVLIMRGEPHDGQRRSLWTGRRRWSPHAALPAKLERAAEAGAAAALVVSPPLLAGKHDLLYCVWGGAEGPLPSMRVSAAAADALLAVGGGERALADLARAINAGGRPASRRLDVVVRGRADMVPGRGCNIIGTLPATEGDGRRKVVVGAHYDHLSIWGKRARDPGFAIRPGADDNASGVAAVILLARAMAAAPQRRLGYVFAAFDGEEYGFFGSGHFVARSGDVKADVAAMLCFDQVGRMRKNELIVTGNVWDEPIGRAMREANHDALGLRIWALPFVNTRGWSDQAPFARRGVPTMLFYTGHHAHYHRVGDTVERINADGGARVGRYAFGVLRRLEAAEAARADD